MERLLRHTRTPAGLIFNGTALRLVSAPAGENSGWLDFRVADMLQTAGPADLRGHARTARPDPAASDARRQAPRRIAERQPQVPERGQRAPRRAGACTRSTSCCAVSRPPTTPRGGELLGRELVDEPDEIYRGLLTVVLRLVFLLYAEERDMLPQSEVFLGAYSVSGLYERLREDAAVHPDTMDQRYSALTRNCSHYGAWSTTVPEARA